MSQPAPATRVRTAKIWADTVRQDVCQAASCRRTIWFAQNVKTGNFLPLDAVTPLAKERELETERESWTIDLAQSHFASCPASTQFRGRGRR